MDVASYPRQEWPRLLASASDRADLVDTYDEWLQSAQRTLLKLGAQGITVEKTDVGVDELVSWCQQEHRALDGTARASYVSLKVQRRLEKM